MQWSIPASWGFISCTRLLSRCSKLIAIKLCAISEMHAKVRRESVAGYATDETLACGPKEHTRWWQRYRGHLQGLLYRLILNSYLMPSLPIQLWLARPWRRFMPSAILRLTPRGGFRGGSRGATPRLEATISTSRPPIWRATTTHCRKR